MKIRIKSTPLGEAPEQVRQAWIGLEIPVPARFSGRRKKWGVGVLSGPRSLYGFLVAFVFGHVQRYEGYTVSARVAVELLAVRSPEAADWWRKHAPHLFTRERHFIFPAENCEEIPEDHDQLSKQLAALAAKSAGATSARPQRSEKVRRSQPVPDVTDTDVRRVALRDFGAEKLALVLSTIGEFEKKRGRAPGARVSLAILKMAQGDLDHLRQATQLAIEDDRDAIVGAEYPRYMREVGFSEVPAEVVQKVIAADWQQYREWLDRK